MLWYSIDIPGTTQGSFVMIRISRHPQLHCKRLRAGLVCKSELEGLMLNRILRASEVNRKGTQIRPD